MIEQFEDELGDLVHEFTKKGVANDEIISALETKVYALKEEADEDEDDDA